MRSFSAFSVAVALLAFAVHSAQAQIFPNINPAITLTTDIKTLTQDGQYITVSWSGVPNATISDVIALYVLDTATTPPPTPDTLRPLRFTWAKNALGGNANGSGNVTFYVINQRANIGFYYFYNIKSTNGSVPAYTNAGVIATAQVVNGIANQPHQGHLTFSGVPGEVVVQWTSNSRALTPTVVLTVAGSTAAQNFTSANAKVTNQTYLRVDMLGPRANSSGYFFPGYFITVTIPNLTPSTTYNYQYGSPEFGFKSGTFTTPPAVSSKSTLRFIAWADSGQALNDNTLEYDYDDDYDKIDTEPPGTPTQVFYAAVDTLTIQQASQYGSVPLIPALVNEINTFQPTIAFHEGDISYARGAVTQWDYFFNQYLPVFTRVPVMMCPGNHERDYPASGDRYWPYAPNTVDSGGEGGVAYQRRMNMPLQPFGQPAALPGQHLGVQGQWYSFNEGPVHFLQISTEEDFSPGSPQWIFIVSDLQSVNRTTTPWVIVGMHRPIYTSSLNGVTYTSDQGVASDLRKALEQIFFIYQVDMTWSGHVHVYERTCPVYQKTCLGKAADGTANGPVHTCFGNGGYDLSWFVRPFVSNYTDALVVEHGYVRGEINATTFHLQAYASETGRLLDDFTLTKPAGWTPSIANRTLFIERFVSTYMAPYYEDPGLSIADLGNTLLTPVAGFISTQPALLGQLAQAALVRNNSAIDNVVNLNQIFSVFYAVARNTTLLQAISPNATQGTFYLDTVIGPLFQLLANNAAAAATVPGFDAGIFKSLTAPNPSIPTPSPTATPSTAPSSTPSATPSTNPSGTPSSTPSSTATPKFPFPPVTGAIKPGELLRLLFLGALP